MRRTGVALLTVVVALGGVILLLLFLQGRDRSQLHSDPKATSGPGQTFPAGQLPADAGSGPEARLLALTRRGNVVLLYGTRTPPAGLAALARDVAGPSDPALAASGQAVLLLPRDGVNGIVALAWRHEQQAADASDPALREFADYWLGRGASG